MVDRSRTGIAGLDKTSFLGADDGHGSSSSSLLTGQWQPDGSGDSLAERMHPKRAAQRHDAQTGGYDLAPAAGADVGMDLGSMAEGNMAPGLTSSSSPSKVRRQRSTSHTSLFKSTIVLKRSNLAVECDVCSPMHGVYFCF